MQWIRGCFKASVRSSRQVMVDVEILEPAGCQVKRLQLQGTWTEVKICKDTEFAAFALETNVKTVEISEQNTALLIVHPDESVAVTDVAQSVFCERKGALKGIFGRKSHPLTYWQFRGIFAHALMEHFLRGGDRLGNCDMQALAAKILAESRSSPKAAEAASSWPGQCCLDLQDSLVGMQRMASRYEIDETLVKHLKSGISKIYANLVRVSLRRSSSGNKLLAEPGFMRFIFDMR